MQIQINLSAQGNMLVTSTATQRDVVEEKERWRRDPTCGLAVSAAEARTCHTPQMGVGQV